MNKETFEGEHDDGVAPHAMVSEENKGAEVGLSYRGYVFCGGIINEEDYRSALERARAGEINEILGRHAENIANFSGISLDTLQSEIDPRVLYGILRKDVGARELEHHHSQMSDQRLLVETLRMLQKSDAVRAVEKAHPQINFN